MLHAPVSVVRTLLALLALPILLIGWSDPSWALPNSGSGLEPPHHYVCDGNALQATPVRGPVDEPTLPDPSSGPVPIGGFMLIAWRGQHLQLPRTNNAAAASFTDGRWWWSLEDADHPSFRRRGPGGAIESFACERVP
jgi:hypothetical protein